jgi:cysteine-rich repeat protein
MSRAWLLLVLAGCSSIIGIGDVTFEGDAPPPPNTVIGRSFYRCVAATGTADLPIDQSATIIQALLPDLTAPTGYRVVDGLGMADGTFRIDNVPDGLEYILKLGKRYFVTSAHVIDDHVEIAQRCSPPPAPATSPTNVMFAVTGMQPFLNGPNRVFDEIEIDSFSLAYFGSTTLQNNASSLATTWDWTAEGGGLLGPAPLLDAAAMDDLTAFHMRDERIAGSKRTHDFRHIVDVFQRTDVTLTSGVAATVTGTFVPATVNKSVLISVSRNDFDSLYDTSTQRGLFTVAVSAVPVTRDFGSAAVLAMVFFTDWSRSTSLFESVMVNYADPMPASWERFISVDYDRHRLILHPGTTIPSEQFSPFGRTFAFTGTLPVLGPSLVTPTNVELGGADAAAGGKLAFDAVKPVTVRWNAVAGATLYQLHVQRSFASTNETSLRTTATLSTTKTSIDIPAEVFNGGEFFCFTLEAVQTPADYASGAVRPSGLPGQVTAFPSGLFRLSATCGNGTVDSGEDCDAGGESATCDVDCTLRMCGDGLRNAAAGEQCDTVDSTDGCDADCTLPACGDGFLNREREDCDDGNTVDNGNGCSAACKLNNVCGDGVKQANGEQCDSGGVDSATCDADCTTPFCPDGHRNAAAGEQCDDGNTDNTDGCTSACKVM